MEFKAGRTVAQILQITGEEADTVRKRWSRKVQDSGGRAFGDAGGQDAVPTEEEFLAMWGKKAARAKQMSVATPSTVRLPELPRQQAVKPKTKTDYERAFAFYGSLAINACSIGLTISGLLLLIEWAGIFVGLMFAFTLGCALIAARNRMKGDTSTTALRTVLGIELGAALLHPFVFHAIATSKGWPDSEILWAACGMLSVAVVAMSFRSVVFVRQFFAEV